MERTSLYRTLTGKQCIMKSHKELKVYQLAFESAMDIFELSKSFPKDEAYSLTDQIRRSSRSVCSNIAEACRKRRYENDFILKLSLSESEAAETLAWLDFALQCNYISASKHAELYDCYDHIIGMLINMIRTSHRWIIRSANK